MSETFDFGDTLGAAFIGGLLTTFLFGITCTQAFHYYQRSPKDPWLLKKLVGFVLVCDTAHMILAAQSIYWYVITNFSNPKVVTLIPSSLAASLLVTTVSDTAVRIFFARRIWILSSGSCTLTIPLAVLIVLIFIAGVGLCVIGLVAVAYKKAESQYWLVRTTLTLTVVGDFYVAISLCLLLYRARSGMNTSNSVVHNLMVYSINTGLLTAITSGVCLASSIALPLSFISVAAYLPLSKLYCNALLATLNAREGLRSTIQAQNVVESNEF